MSFPLEVPVAAAPSPAQLARARIIAAEHPGCDATQVECCGLDEDGERIHGCRCLHEAMESGSG